MALILVGPCWNSADPQASCPVRCGFAALEGESEHVVLLGGHETLLDGVNAAADVLDVVTQFLIQ